MLETIVAQVRADLVYRLDGFGEVRHAVQVMDEQVKGFPTAIAGPGLAVIAEVKRRSPSRGAIDLDLDPVQQATRYVEGGAAAVSVLTEEHHFAGSPEDLKAVAAAVTAPVLRKDFVVHPMQVWEARLWGASAVLLITAILTDNELRGLRAEAETLGLSALVEVHDEEEAHRALRSGASIVGVNNRDLNTFAVDLSTAERLRPVLDDAVLTVAESGIWTSDDAGRMRDAGYDGVLVGEALVRADDPAVLIGDLR